MRHETLVLNGKTIVVVILMITVLIAPAFFGNRSTRADEGMSLFETNVMPGSDPDPRNETSLAVSSQSDLVLVGASKVILGGGTAGRGDTRVAYYYSSDGGRSWGTGLLGLETTEKTWGRATHPSLASDLNGNFYLCVLMLDNSNFDSGLYVFKSTDNGQTFINPMPVVTSIGNISNPKRIDQCRMTVDASPSSPYKNSVYAVWTSTGINEFGQNTTVILLARRREGQASFSESRAIGHSGDMRGPSLSTGPNGEFYAAWVGMPARSLLFNASTDGGDTFLPGLASIDMTVHNFVGNLEGPNAPFSIVGLDRANSFPTIDVDRSAGPHRGVVYVAWAETTNRRDTDVFVRRITRSTNSLPEVSLPVKVNNDSSAADQFFPWLSVDSSTGAVEVSFYDRRDDPGGMLMNMYLARSTNGGVSFGENIKISSAASDPRVQASVLGSTASAIGIGDYLGMVARRDTAHILWTDTRRGKQEILYGQLGFGGVTPPPTDQIPNDICQSPRIVASTPYSDVLNTGVATTSSDDPLLCTVGSAGSNTVWYSITPAINTVYGVDTGLSDYGTVVSVYTGECGSLSRIACSDDFGSPPDTPARSVLSFPTTAGVTYLILASGKGSGGSLKIRVGHPTITGVEFTQTPDGTDALKITGAGFFPRDAAVTVNRDGEDIALPTIITVGPPLPDGTETAFFATKKKLKKLVKRRSVLVRVESPVGSGNISNSFRFTR